MENRDEGVEFTLNRMKTVALPRVTEKYGVIPIKIWKCFFGGVMNNKRLWVREKVYWRMTAAAKKWTVKIKMQRNFYRKQKGEWN